MNRLGVIWFQNESEIEFERKNRFWKSMEEVTSKVVAICDNNYENVIHPGNQFQILYPFKEVLLLS